ncbi:MAG: cation transporter [Acidobacteriales bacterium]|nr:cation transporter [Terriglobales bacterium]
MNEKIGVFGALAGAVLASVCCIGPLVLAGLGVGAVAAAQSFAPYRPLFLAVTVVFLGLGFYFAYRKPKQAACEGEVCEAPRVARWGRPLLWIATAIVAALVAFPYYYGPLRAAFDKPKLPAPVAAAPAQFSTVELKVSGMTCGRCAVSVRNALLETPGVTSASVDHEAGRATVQYDPSKASATQLIEAVNKTGFRASL